MKSRIALLVVAVVASLLLAPGAASANHSWGSYHWERSSNPVNLVIGDNVSSQWDARLDAAIVDWNRSSVLNLSEAAGVGGTRCSPSAGRIEVCSASYGNNGWLGLASISVSGSHITSATAKMNDTYFSTPQYNTTAWRQMVMCQEIGHAFGLSHQDENFDDAPMGTCMDYTNNPEPNQRPDSHDYDQLESIYAHFDGGTSGGGGGSGTCPPKAKKCKRGRSGVTDADLIAPGDLGQLVREKGREAVYERDFGNGNRVVTFVIWAD